MLGVMTEAQSQWRHQLLNYKDRAPKMQQKTNSSELLACYNNVTRNTLRDTCNVKFGSLITINKKQLRSVQNS